MKRLLAAAILAVLHAFYYITAVILIHYIGDTGTAAAILFGLLYGAFMIVTLGTIFTSLPKSISRYYLNDP